MSLLWFTVGQRACYSGRSEKLSHTQMGDDWPGEGRAGLGSQQELESPGQEGRLHVGWRPVRHGAQPGLLRNLEKAVKFAVSGFGKHRVRVSGAAGSGEGQAQLISCQSGPEAPAPLRLATGEEMPGMAHIPLAGATPDLRGPVGSEEVDVLRPELGALCRDQASAVQPFGWRGARGCRAEQKSITAAGALGQRSPTLHFR